MQRNALCAVLSLSLICLLVAGIIPTAFAAESDDTLSVQDLQQMWDDQSGKYPGKATTVYIPPLGGNVTSYQLWVINHNGIAVDGNGGDGPKSTGIFVAGKYTTLDTGGITLNGSLEGTAGVKLKCLDSERNAFYQWLTFATIDEACKWAEDGDTIVLNCDYDDYTLNGLKAIRAQQQTKNGPATVEYNVSPNFTIPADKNITLDLNGHKIEASTNVGRTGTVSKLTNWTDGNHVSSGEVTERIGITVSENASLTIIDSSEGKTGEIIGTKRAEYPEDEDDENKVDESQQDYHLIVNNGTLVIADGITLSNPARDEGESDATAYDVYQGKKSTTVLPVSMEVYTNDADSGEDDGPTVTQYAISPAIVTAGQTAQLSITPALPTGAAVTWTSAKSDVATVNEAGVVTGVAAGETEITAAITVNGAALATAKGTVTVTAKSSSGGGSSTPSYSVTTPSEVDNGSVSVSPKSARKGSTVTITVKPDDGYELDKLTVTDKNGDALKLTDKGDGKYTFTMPASKVEIEASFKQIVTEPENPFTDVSASAYYYDAVLWAVENGVTEGTSATTFSPDMSCTRAQMVTFLWRAAGSPEPVTTTNPFTDVSSGVYYYDAVLWAVEQGITIGTSATTFAPDATVTRSQTVTFLYRAAGTPEVSGGSFADVDANAYYADAVAWAVSEGVTVGTSDTTFSPDADCTRGQIVTFMYRAAQ